MSLFPESSFFTQFQPCIDAIHMWRTHTFSPPFDFRLSLFRRRLGKWNEPILSCAASGVFRTYRIRQHEFSARNKTFTIAGAAYAADPDAEYSAPGRQCARGVQRVIHVRARCQTYVVGKP